MDKKEYAAYSDDEFDLQLSSRIMNLVWTVSGSYDVNYMPDLKLYKKSKAMCLYDAIKHGAFAKYYDMDTLSIYMLKKLYCDADYENLYAVTQMAVEAACRSRISEERGGVADIRSEALDDMLEHDFKSMVHSPAGRMKLALIKAYSQGSVSVTKAIRPAIEKIMSLENETDTLSVIKTIDEVYNDYFDKTFEKTRGSFDDVMSITLQQLANNDWTDYLKDEVYADELESVIQQISASVTNLTQEATGKNTKAKMNIKYLDNADIQKMNVHVENTFGKSYLSENESRKITNKLCKGISSDCKLHFTEGILSTLPPEHYRYKYAQNHFSKNKLVYFDNHRVVKKNISVLTSILKNALIKRSETERMAGDFGSIAPKKLWQIGRTSRPQKLFERTVKRDESDFVVDVLIDGSGSQSSRQGKVALQAYILSEALSALKIPHRIMSYCTFWEYTVLIRLRDYDDPQSKNSRIFEYMTSSNNRDGLAVKAACDALLQRGEENKILIVLSDGRPNDININNPNATHNIMYTGEAAIKDTAHEVRAARELGISVLGVFAGEEDDLAAEKLIFGKDFAYIRNISNFSNVVGMYLVKQIED